MYRHGNTVQGDFYRACSINQLLLSITFARHFSEKTIPILKKMQKIPLTAFTFNIRDRSPISSVLTWENLLSNLGPKAAVVTLTFGRDQSKITNKLSSKYTDSFKQPLGGFCCAGASFLSGSSENNNKSLCLD